MVGIIFTAHTMGGAIVGTHLTHITTLLVTAPGIIGTATEVDLDMAVITDSEIITDLVDMEVIAIITADITADIMVMTTIGEIVIGVVAKVIQHVIQIIANPIEEIQVIAYQIGQLILAQLRQQLVVDTIAEVQALIPQ